MIFRHILLWFKFLFFVLYKQRQFIDNLYSNSHHYVLILFALVIETIFQMHDSANFCLCNHQQNYSIRTLWIVFSVSLFNLFLAVFSKKYLRSLIEIFFFSFILVYEEINFDILFGYFQICHGLMRLHIENTYHCYFLFIIAFLHFIQWGESGVCVIVRNSNLSYDTCNAIH